MKSIASSVRPVCARSLFLLRTGHQPIREWADDGGFDTRLLWAGGAAAVTNALEQTSTNTYSAAGDLTRMSSPDGNSVQFEHDEQGRLKAHHFGAYSQQFDYDEAGRLSKLTNENGAHTTFTYDVMGRLTTQVNFDGRTQSPNTDWAQQVHGHRQQEHFNLLGREQAAPQANGPVTRWPDNHIGYSANAVWRYDSCGNRVEQLGQDGRRQMLGYDGGHQLSEVATQGPAIGMDRTNRCKPVPAATPTCRRSSITSTAW